MVRLRMVSPSFLSCLWIISCWAVPCATKSPVNICAHCIPAAQSAVHFIALLLRCYWINTRSRHPIGISTNRRRVIRKRIN
ncbi:hypothetical protein BKA93DRAFT_75211 [Sparassis latifolia]